MVACGSQLDGLVPIANPGLTPLRK